MASGKGKSDCNLSPEDRVRNNGTVGQSANLYPDLTQFQNETQNDTSTERIAETHVCILNITESKANTGRFSWCILVELGIDLYLKKQDVNIQDLKVAADKKTIRIENTEYENEQIKKLIEEFMKSIHVISVSDIYKPKIPQNKSTNEGLLNFIRTHIDVIPQTHVVVLHSDEKGVFLGSKDKQSLQIVVAYLKNEVVKRKFNIADGECKEMINALQTSRKLFILFSDEETVHMLCTKDAIKQLDENMECILEVRLCALQIEYFDSFGKTEINKLSLKTSIQIDLNKENKTLRLRGKRCYVKSMEDRLRTHFMLKNQTTALPRKMLPTFEGNVKEAANAQQCCYAINWRPFTENGHGNRMIASWKSRDGNGLTLIEGRLFHLNVNVVVILSNTSMCPLTHIPEQDMEMQINEVRLSLEKNDERIQLGGTRQVLNQKPQRLFLAISDSNSATSSSFDETKCYQVLKVHLERLRGEGNKSVAIHASVYPQTHVSTKDITKWFIKASLEVPGMSYYLCAGSEDDLHQIAEDIRLNCMSLKGSQNYLRQTFAADVVFGGRRNLDVQNCSGISIVNQKADIIVNTTGRSLKLEKGGGLSRSIAWSAGEQIQNELSKKYPSGLSEGQIAVTSSGNLTGNGVHEILHCVLPKFNKETFDEDIKSMVKTCLAEADQLQRNSIALPPFGIGKHEYPIRETALAMFEAIDEFSEESVGTTLQTIYITVLETKEHTHCKAFINAKRKQSSLPERKKLNFDMVDIDKRIGYDEYSLRVCVGNRYLLKWLPRSTLHVYFHFAGGQGNYWRKEEYYDEMWMAISHETLDIKHAVETALDHCSNIRITDVAFFSPVQQLNRKDFTDVEFVKTVVGALENAPTKFRYLRSVLILLASETHIANVEEAFCSTRMNKLRTIAGGMVGTPWQKPADPAVEILVYGAREKTSIAFGNILKITSSPYSFGKETETKKELNIGTDVDHDYEEIEPIQTKPKDCETPKVPLIDAQEVRLSATINQGFVKYLQSHEALDAWSIDVEKCFDISLQSSKNCLKVQGRCRNVSMFETYLQNFFPNKPDYAKSQMEPAYSGLSFDDRHFADVSNDGTSLKPLTENVFKSST